MAVQELAHGVYAVALGSVNVFLLESEDGLVLIDTGTPGSDEQLLLAVKALGKQPGDIRHILVTHWHPDHMGGLAALKRASGAQTYAHPVDAPIIREGGDFDPKNGTPRHFYPGPGRASEFERYIQPAPGIEGAAIDHEINETDTLAFLPALKVIFAPGHSGGQIVFLLQMYGGVLFAADTCSNFSTLGWSLGYEDLAEGKRTLKKLCDYDFQIVTFGHGEAILTEAADRWRAQWGNLQIQPG